MIEPIIITRGGIEYNVYKGVELGESTIYLESIEPVEKGLKVRLYPASLNIEFNNITRKGSSNSIKTEWRRSLLYPTGEIFDESTIEWMITKLSDIATFNTIFGNPILTFMINGVVRDTLGYDELPVYNSSGVVITYTEEQENSLPTNNYRTT